MFWFVFIVTTLIAGTYSLLRYELGAASVHAAIFLVARGCVRFEAFTLRPLALQNLVIRQPSWLGRHTVFSAQHFRIQRVKGLSFLLRFSKPNFNFLGNDEGLLHLVALLQDVGYLEESKATERPNSIEVASGEVAKSSIPPQTHRTAFQGEAHVAFAHLTFREGELTLPYDVGQIIGNTLRATAAAGANNVARLRTKLSKDIKHLLPLPGVSDASRGSVPSGRQGRRHRYPVLLHLKSDHLQSYLEGWRTDTGFQLARPIISSAHAIKTPSLTWVCGQPPGQGRDLRKPHSGGYAPALRDDFSEAEPMKVLLQTKALVKSLIRLLNSVGKKEWEEPCRLEAWASSVAADVYRSGLIVSKRMDILLGHDVGKGKGMHVTMWGNVDAGSNAISMTLGIPAHSLRRLGARDVSEDFVYQIAVAGTTTSPEIDWLRAGKDLAAIVMKTRLQKGIPFLERMFRRSEDKFASQGAIPAPTLPFPWEAFATGVDIDEESVLALHDPPASSSGKRSDSWK